MKKRMGSILRGIIFVIALVVFIFSAYKIYTTLAEYKRGTDEYKEIAEEVLVEETVADENKEEETAIFKVDFEKLHAMNKETVAWIRFENPSQINYPVLHTSDNEKYLKTTFEKNRNSAGAIFMDAQNVADFSDRNTIIYGHNMKNDTMFGKLEEYKKYDFYKQNPYFYIYTPDGIEHKYQVFAAAVVEDTATNYRKQFANDQEFLEYLQSIMARSIYKSGIEVTAESRIITLSTCTNVTDTQRFVVHGVKVEEKVIGE